MLIISWTDYTFHCHKKKHFCPDQNHLRSKWEQQNFTNTSTGRRDTGYCDNCNTCKRNIDTHLQGITGCKWAAGQVITGTCTLAGQKKSMLSVSSNLFFFEGCLVQTSGRIETTNLRCQVCNHGLWPCCDCGTRIQKGWLVLLIQRLYNHVQRPFVDLFTIFKELFWRLFHSGYYFTVETEQQSTLETCD